MRKSLLLKAFLVILGLEADEIVVAPLAEGADAFIADVDYEVRVIEVAVAREMPVNAGDGEGLGASAASGVQDISCVEAELLCLGI